MIRIIKGQPIPPAVRSQIDEHPLGIAAQLLHAIGFAITVGGLSVMFLAIATSAVEPINPTTVLTAAGTAFAGAVLISQGDTLYRRVLKTKLDDASPTSPLWPLPENAADPANSPVDWAHRPHTGFTGPATKQP